MTLFFAMLCLQMIYLQNHTRVVVGFTRLVRLERVLINESQMNEA